jgi:hypothetical protein
VKKNWKYSQTQTLMKNLSLTAAIRITLVVTTIAILNLRCLGVPVYLDSDTFNGHTYYLLETSNWMDAESQAIALGGHLATVSSKSENDWIFTDGAQAEACGSD